MEDNTNLNEQYNKELESSVIVENQQNTLMKYRCDICDVNFLYPKDLMRHKMTPKHNKAISGIPKNPKEFYCKLCDYKCNKSFNWYKHISTEKHQRHFLNKEDSDDKNKTFMCNICNKTYTKYNSYWKHMNKNCNKKSEEKEKDKEKEKVTPKTEVDIELDANFFKNTIKERSEEHTSELQSH